MKCSLSRVSLHMLMVSFDVLKPLWLLCLAFLRHICILPLRHCSFRLSCPGQSPRIFRSKLSRKYIPWIRSKLSRKYIGRNLFHSRKILSSRKMRCTLFKAWPIFGLDCDCEKVPPVPVEIGINTIRYKVLRSKH